MAFDFDDMEAEAEARLAAGQGDDEAALSALASVEAPGLWDGGVLPPMRNSGCAWGRDFPSVRDLGEYLPKMAFPAIVGGGPRVRLFCFYGAGDSVAAWANFMTQLPSWIDAAIFECPGHGRRSAEEIPASVPDNARLAFDALSPIAAEHAKGGALEGAPIALAGHSMGVQVAIEIGVLLKRRLAIEPVALFCMDRGAPDIPIYTEEGYKRLCEDEPTYFFEGFNPLIHRLLLRPTRAKEKETERMIRMWQKDLKRAQEHVWSEGQHIFRCEVHVFRALRNFAMDKAAREGQLKPEFKRVHEINCVTTNSGSKSSSVWSWASYEEWQRWTAASCVVHDIDADHVTIKDHPNTLDAVLSSLGRLLKVPCPQPE